ncbi:MAG: type I methionyl aminopeptidase [Bdellovibrionaceae bacterium]|nr:type I methionyl aminopeptidase [Pseudobdellovibrionaceae bacterium]MBX3034783.1 type I methionyl aminopeptidase [Pseudobdellovibrionaceae bacterium]
MSITSEKDLDGLRRIGRIVARCLQLMHSKLEPGITTAELDALGGAFLASQGARSAPRLTYDFPGDTCISVNEEAAHGIPGVRVIRAGDLVNIDVSAELDGYFADTGGSAIVPPESKLHRQLCDVTRQALENALLEARAGAKLNRIGLAIETEARRHGLTVIENLGSHGVGRALHEEPGFIAGYYDKKDRRVLRENQVITIEPFVSSGAREVSENGDGWTLVTSPGVFTAQYEHTIVITKGKPLIMTLPA